MTLRTEFSLGAQEPAAQTQGTYTPGGGFKVADTPRGDLSVRIWAYTRYLNQQALDD